MQRQIDYHPKTPHYLLQARAFQRVLEKIQKLVHLNRTLSRVLGPEAGMYCQCMSYAEGVLTVAVTNASFATRLRFAESDLLEAFKLHTEFTGIQRIVYKMQVQKIGIHSRSLTVPKKKISLSSQQHIQQMAQHIKNEALQNALLSLGRK